ncbi:hypothetical protein CIT26_30925 [Mesorhizobium temperatum]|uniref:Uncharacterized protein n=1 Tax=Mesorhizobium temperatum TaxID=241416 RepID=A0A271LDB5_9HYPH|nr:hypothetical protein CIT26_30925 [Mesorhizobium temperatum]
MYVVLFERAAFAFSTMVAGLLCRTETAVKMSVMTIAAEVWLKRNKLRPLDVLGAELIKQRVIVGTRHLQRFDRFLPSPGRAGRTQA